MKKAIFVSLMLAVIIISVYMLVDFFRYKSDVYINFVRKTTDSSYKQGDVVIYTRKIPDRIENCELYTGVVLNSARRFVGNAYCYMADNYVNFNIDTSEFSQGKYFLMVIYKNNKSILKDSFNVEITNIRE